MIWFEYGPGISPGFGDRPCVPVRLFHRSNGRLSEPIPVLVDSGADCTVFPAGMARQLGVDLDAARDVPRNRFGRQVTAGNVFAVIAGIPVTLQPRFALDEDILVLGRYDFGAHFKVTFDELGQRVGLKSYPLDVRGHHPAQAPGCGLREPDPPPAWVAGTSNGRK